MRSLLDSVFADGLENLNLRYNPFGDEGALILANSDRLRRLKLLYLSGDDLQEAARQALEKRFGDVLLM